MCVCVLVSQSCLTLCNPMNCSLPDSSVHLILQARILEWVAISSARRCSWPRDQTQVSCMCSRFFTIWTIREAHSRQMKVAESDSLWPHGLYSPRNSPGQTTEVSSHCLLQGIFPTQGLNPGLLHCRWTLNQLSHQGSPYALNTPKLISWNPLSIGYLKRTNLWIY